MTTFPKRDPLVIEPFPGVLIEFATLPSDFREGATILPGRAQELRQKARVMGRLFETCYDQRIQDKVFFEGRVANLALSNEKPLDPANRAPALVEFVRSVSDYVIAKEIVEARMTGADGLVEQNDPVLHRAMETMGLARKMETPAGRSFAAAIDRWLYQCSLACEQVFDISINGEHITLKLPSKNRIFPAGESLVAPEYKLAKCVEGRLAVIDAALLLGQEGQSCVVPINAIRGRPVVGRRVKVSAHDLTARRIRIRVFSWKSNETADRSGDHE